MDSNEYKKFKVIIQNLAKDKIDDETYSFLDNKLSEIRRDFVKVIEKPRLFNVIRCKADESIFNEQIRFFDREGNLVHTSNNTHPESRYNYVYRGYDYLSLPCNSNVYHRKLEL